MRRYDYALIARRLTVLLLFSWGVLVLAFVLISPGDHDVKTKAIFPLVPGNWWEFEGTEIANERRFRTRLAADQREQICGVTVVPLIFFKDQTFGYWGPGADLNLVWFLVDFSALGSKHPDFFWALGDKRYRRDRSRFDKLGEFSEFVLYESARSSVPPYAIFSRKIKSGWSMYPKNFYYFSKDNRTDCDWIKKPSVIDGKKTARWSLKYTLADTAVPAYRGRTVKVRFLEDFGDQDWLEDWYFAENIGPVKIETFSQGQKLIGNLPATHRLELVSYFVRNQSGEARSYINKSKERR